MLQIPPLCRHSRGYHRCSKRRVVELIRPPASHGKRYEGSFESNSPLSRTKRVCSCGATYPPVWRSRRPGSLHSRPPCDSTVSFVSRAELSRPCQPFAIQVLCATSTASQRSPQSEPFFRLLLKDAVRGAHQCEFRIFEASFGAYTGAIGTYGVPMPRTVPGYLPTLRTLPNVMIRAEIETFACQPSATPLEKPVAQPSLRKGQ